MDIECSGRFVRLGHSAPPVLAPAVRARPGGIHGRSKACRPQDPIPGLLHTRALEPSRLRAGVAPPLAPPPRQRLGKNAPPPPPPAADAVPRLPRRGVLPAAARPRAI